jgi:hypothetical protein
MITREIKRRKINFPQNSVKPPLGPLLYKEGMKGVV